MIAQPESTIAELPGHVGAAAYPNIRAFESHPGDADAVSRQTLGRGLLVLSTIRLFEKWLIDNVSLVHGPLHSSIGQEAVAVGMGLALRPQDRITATHRAHHHVLAKQLTYHMPEGYDPFLPGPLPNAA